MKVKSKAAIQKNYSDATTLAATRYKDAVPTAEWKDSAIAGQDVYVARMSDPAVLARRVTGIEKKTDAQWRDAAITKGAPVIGGRMKAAAPDMADGFEPYRRRLEATELPPRTADGMENLINRAGAVVAAMLEEKEAQG